MKRFLKPKLIFLLVTVVMLLSAIVLPLSGSLLRSHAAGPSSLKDNPPPSTVAADPFNARLAIQVGTDGRFNIGAYPDPSTGGATSGSWDLMYSWPDAPWSSFSTLNIDGSNSIYGSSGTQIGAPQDTDAKTNQSSWQVGDIQASQSLQLALNDQTAQEDNAKIAYSLTNKGTVAHTVGMRIMIDTEVNGNDGAILRIPGIGLVRKESEFTGANVPDTMQSFFDVTDNQHVAAVTLKSGGATPPDRLVIAAWPHLDDAVYDYTIDPNYDFTDPSVSRPDSAYAVYWNPVSLAPGQSLNYVTYYGLSQLNVDLSPPLALGVSGPATLSVINNAYSPNPFTVTATVLNNGTADANNVALTLHLPNGLSLSSGTATQNLGTLPVGQERDISWSVQAASQSVEQTLTYSVDAVATNTTLKNVARQITLPPLSTPNPTGQKLFVFVEGLSTNSDTRDFANIQAALLKKNPGAQFLYFSYAGSDSYGNPNAYICYDTLVNSIKTYVGLLRQQIIRYMSQPSHANTSVYIIGHSMGGAIAYGLLADMIVHGYIKTNGGQIAGDVALDSPLGGVPEGPVPEFLPSWYYNLTLNNYQANPACVGTALPGFKSQDLYDLTQIFNPGDTPYGANDSLSGRVTGIKVSNQIIATVAAGHGIHVLTIGNLLDFVYQPGACPGLGFFPHTHFIDTQLINDGKVTGLGIYSRPFAANVQGGATCPDTDHIAVNHGVVFNTQPVIDDLVQFAAGGTPSQLI